MKLILASCVFVSASALASAPFPQAPSHAHLKKLEPLMGAVWETRMDTPQGAALEQYSYDWIANGAFVVMTHTMTFGEHSHSEYAMIGWDPEAEKLRYWGFLSDGSFFDGHETNPEKDALVTFDVKFTGSSFVDRAKLSMGVSGNSLVHGMVMPKGEGWTQSYESRSARKGDMTKDTVNGYQVSVVTLKAQPMLTIRTTVKPDEIAAALGKLYGRIGMHMSQTGATFAGAPFAIYHSFEETVDMEAGIPIDRKVESAGEVKFGELPAGRAAKLDFYGHYDDLIKGHEAMDEFLKRHQLEASGPPWEAYVTDPTTEPDSSKWKTEIYYPLK